MTYFLSPANALLRFSTHTYYIVVNIQPQTKLYDTITACRCAFNNHHPRR